MTKKGKRRKRADVSALCELLFFFIVFSNLTNHDLLPLRAQSALPSSASLSRLHFFYKKHHFNYSLPVHLSLNRTMPENDQPQADESPLKTWIKRHLVSLNHDESTVGERSDFQTVF